MSEELLALILLLLFFSLLFFFTTRIRAGHRPSLRRIPGFDELRRFAGQSVESGRPLHLSLGVGRATDVTTADSLAGIYTLNYLAEQAAATDLAPIVSMADPTVMLLAQNALREAYGADSQGAQVAYRDVRFMGPQPSAHAAGVMSVLGTDDVATNLMIGRFGDEYLLMGEASARRNTDHIGGTSDPNTLPFIYATAQETLLGEEIYAAGAYLQRKAFHVGSLLTQDTMRWIIGLIIIGGVIMTSLR